MQRRSKRWILTGLLCSACLASAFVAIKPISFFQDTPKQWRERPYQLCLLSLKEHFLTSVNDPDGLYHALHHSASFFEHELGAALEILTHNEHEWSARHYREFLSHLRIALSSHEYQAVLAAATWKKEPLSCSARLAQTLASAVFTSAPLYSVHQEVVSTLATVEAQVSPAKQHGLKALKQKRQAILDASSEMKISPSRAYFASAMEVFFYDPIMEQNPPYPLFSSLVQLPDGNRKKIACLHLAPPTQEQTTWIFGNQKAVITPEFEGFLQCYATEGKRHLYINHQNRSLNVFWNDEAARSHAIEMLQCKYHRTFVAVTLPKRSDFYRQKGAYKQLESAKDFKKALKTELFSRNSGFFFPSSLEISYGCDLNRDFKQLIERVHRLYFNQAATLSTSERRQFIDLFYLSLTEYLIKKTAPDSYNLTCKHAVDRAGSIKGLFLFYQLLRSDQIEDPLYQDFLCTAVLAPGLLSKGRPIDREHFKRMFKAARRLSKASGEPSPNDYYVLID